MHTYVGALSYADDITLLCPSIRGLNEMMYNCCEYAEKYNIVFNTKKIGDNVNNYEHVHINNTLVQWTN